MNTDQNLLFGILAFQNNFIDRRALLVAFDQWTADKNKPLGEILVKEKAISADECALLEALVGKHLDRHGGNAEKSLAAVSLVSSVRKDLEQIVDPDVQASLAAAAINRPADA